MTPKKRVVAWTLGWVAAISAAHLGLNVDWSAMVNDWLPRDQRKFNVAYIPVT
jgi:NitT/TauT family transport system substrate-binding protein